jgi:ATP adenylyltransferase
MTGPGREPDEELLMRDGLERLWTPDRMRYIKGEGKPADDSAGDHCPFCRAPGLPDEEALIVARGEHVYAILNIYPYNTGHLLICTYRHIADVTQMSEAEVSELGRFTQRAMTAIRNGMQPQGFNIGINQGPIAGAGIAAHLHQHLVPRWGGDANFMPLIGRTKVLPQDLHDTRRVIADAWT